METSRLSDEVYIDTLKESVRRASQNLNSMLGGGAVMKEMFYEVFIVAAQSLIEKRKKTS